MASSTPSIASCWVASQDVMAASGLSAVMLVSGGVGAKTLEPQAGRGNPYSILPIRRTALTSLAVSPLKNASKAAPSR